MRLGEDDSAPGGKDAGRRVGFRGWFGDTVPAHRSLERRGDLSAEMGWGGELRVGGWRFVEE